MGSWVESGRESETGSGSEIEVGPHKSPSKRKKQSTIAGEREQGHS
jgi:hypothetical protein